MAFRSSSDRVSWSSWRYASARASGVSASVVYSECGVRMASWRMPQWLAQLDHGNVVASSVMRARTGLSSM